MKRKKIRNAVLRRKACTKSEISGDEASKRKYWGTGEKIKEYKQAIVDAVDTEPLENAIDSISDPRREKVVSENLVERLMGSIDFQDLFEAALVDSLKEIVMSSYKEGGSRLLTTDGERFDPFDVSPERIVEQLQKQDIYLKRLSNDAEERVRKSLEQGVEQGKSLADMKQDLVEDVEKLTENRAETIARSEITVASSKGTEQAMEEAGVEKVQMLAEIDDRTCDPGAFSTRVGGREFTSCREWHEAEFDRENAPRPVRDSHPNCRCALLVVAD